MTHCCPIDRRVAHYVRSFALPVCTGTVGRVCGAIQSFVPYARAATRLSHLSGWAADATRLIQDAHCAGRRLATGSGPGGRGTAAAILSVRSELEHGRDHRATSGAAHLSFAGGMQTAAGVSATRRGIRTGSRRRQRGGKKIDGVKTTPCWTRSLRAVRTWLAPAHWLARCWAAFSAMPPPPELAALIEAVVASQGINLYLRI